MKQGERLLEVVERAFDNQDSFGDLLTTAEKKYLMDRGVVRSAEPGEVLCEQHQRDAQVYILVMGEVEVSEGSENNSVVLAHLRQGELFGEISALFKIPRISTVTVSKPSVLLEIPGDIFEEVINNRPTLRDAVIQRYQTRITDTALRAVSLFRHLPSSTLTTLIEESAVMDIPAGAPIVEKGERGDALYIILYGTARVSHGEDGSQMNLALLRPGDYFGEWSILTGAPRAATVSALTRVEVIRVDCKSFLDFIQENPEVRDRIDLVAHNRHEQALHASAVPESAEQLREVVNGIEEIMQGDS